MNREQHLDFHWHLAYARRDLEAEQEAASRVFSALSATQKQSGSPQLQAD